MAESGAPHIETLPGPRSGRLWAIGLLVAILLSAVLMRLPLIDQPFHRNPEAMASYYGLMARNYVRHGLLDGWLLPVQSVGRSDIDPPRLYPNHPPLVPLTVAAVYAIFGEGQWQTRLAPSVFWLGCIAAIYVMVLRTSMISDPQEPGRADFRAVFRAAIAALLFGFVPISGRYGGQPDVINAQLVLFCLLTVAAYQRFFDRPNLRRLAVMALAFLPAALTDWPAFFLVPVLAGHFVLRHRLRHWQLILTFCLYSAAVFGLLYVHIALVTGDWRLIFDQFLRRSARMEDDHHRAFSWGSWVVEAGGNGLWAHTWMVVALAGLWVVCVGLDWRRCSRLISLTRLLLAFAVVHVLVGRQGVLVHDWWWWPVTPGLCVAAALGLDLLVQVVAGLWARGRAIGSILAIGAVGAFAIWQARTAVRWYADPHTIYGDNPAYTVVELGQAIHAAAEPNEAVMLAEDDPQPYTWYYADRPLKLGIWTVADLEARRDEPWADLPFGYRQQWTPPARAIVIPRVWLAQVAELDAHLSAHYQPIALPPPLAQKFIAYRLDAP